MTLPPNLSTGNATGGKMESEEEAPFLSPSPWRIGDLLWNLRQPLIMGVLNLTPDSFSDGGEYTTPQAALARARELRDAGADIIDIGGASSHPRARAVSIDTEMERVLPILAGLKAAEIKIPLSIDTQQPVVAEACLELGANLINDVSGLSQEEMAGLAARYDVPLVIMFNNIRVKSNPNIRVKRNPGQPLMEAMTAFFAEKISRAESAGANRLILDPGYGFGKSLSENIEVLRGFSRLKRFKRPLLVCTSRKGSLGKLTGEKNPKERTAATIASNLFALKQGANIFRVHDVRAFRQALQTWLAVSHPGEIP